MCSHQNYHPNCHKKKVWSDEHYVIKLNVSLVSRFMYLFFHKMAYTFDGIFFFHLFLLVFFFSHNNIDRFIATRTSFIYIRGFWCYCVHKTKFILWSDARGDAQQIYTKFNFFLSLRIVERALFSDIALRMMISIFLIVAAAVYFFFM